MRLLVCGCGRMGQHHVRTVRSSSDFDLVGICDPDPQAQAWVQAQEIRSEARLSDALERFRPDAVIVATPPSQHETCLMECLRARCAVLAEKPLAPSLASSRRVHAAFALAGVPLVPAMVERFNPAMMALRRLLPTLGEIRFLNVVRQGGREPSDRSVPVGLDLAIHDLDLLAHILPEMPTWSRMSTEQGWVECAGDAGEMRIDLSACWAQPAHRKWSLETSQGNVVVDLQARRLWLQEREIPCEGLDSLQAMLGWFALCLQGDVSECGWERLLEIQAFLETQPITATQSISTLTSRGSRPTSMVERAGA